MRSLLLIVALLPLLGLFWLSARQVRQGIQTRAEVTELQEASDLLNNAVSLEINLLEEHAWLQGVRLATSLDVPTDVLVAFGGDDLAAGAQRAAEEVDTALDSLDREPIRTEVTEARAAVTDNDLGLASSHYLAALAEARQLVVVASSDLVTRAAALDDGTGVVALARVVEAASSLQAEQSFMTLAFFNGLVGAELSGDDDSLDLVRFDARYRNTFAETELKLAAAPTSSAVDSAWDQLVASQGWGDQRIAIDNAIEQLAGGGSFATDLSDRTSSLLAIAGPYLASEEADDRHEAVTLGALTDLDAVVEEAWAAEQRTNLAITAGALAVVFATAIAVFVVGRLVILPLSELAASAERLRRGTGDERIALRGPVEIRAGAEAINEAMDHIRHAEKQALALAAGRIDDPVLSDTAAGPLGASLHDAVERLRESLAERERFRRRLAHEATHDGLTGLPNRSAALGHLQNTLARAARSESTAAVLFVDLDGFKGVNDQHGHQTGDLLLQAVARRLVDQCRPGDHVARLGGDEFLVIAEPVGSAEDALGLGQRISAAVAEPIVSDRGSFRPSACVGVALAEHDSTPDSLIRDADLAVYRAKGVGPGSVELCTEEMRSRLVEEADLDAAIRRAIVDGEFELHYQSTIDAGTSRPNAVEALVRWNRPGHGMVRPDDFIPFAERTDLIIEIDRWVIDAGISQLAEWHEHPELGELSMALNVSGRHLGRADLYTTVRATLDRYGVDPNRLTIEVTESALLEDLASAARSLDQLRDDGVRIAIDDFGTGYTSLAHLRTLPVDILKIDRSFVANLDNADDLSLVKLIVDTGHLLGARVTAEGVETDDQASILRALGSDTLQGYRFSRPLTAVELVAAVTALRVGT